MIVELLSGIGKLVTPAFKLFEHFSATKADRPLLVQEPNGIDVGSPRWAKELRPTPSLKIHAEGVFHFKNTGGACRFAELVAPTDIFMKIEPTSFAAGDTVLVTFNADRYDDHVLHKKEKLVLKIRVVTESGRKTLLRYKCENYRATPCL